MIDKDVEIEIERVVFLGGNNFKKNKFLKTLSLFDICPGAEFFNLDLNGNTKPNKELRAELYRVDGDFSFRDIFKAIYPGNLLDVCFLKNEIIEFCEKTKDLLLEDNNLWATVFLTEEKGEIVAIVLMSDGYGKLFLNKCDLDEQAEATIANFFCYVVIPIPAPVSVPKTVLSGK